MVFDAESPRLAILVPFGIGELLFGLLDHGFARNELDGRTHRIFFVRDVALENLHRFLKPGGIGVADKGPPRP